MNDTPTFDSVRTELTQARDHIVFLKNQYHDVPEVAELTLAMRGAEDARMRVGVAQAYNNNQDPWTPQTN